MAVNGSLRVFCLCVYSFVICWSHLIVFGAHFAILLSLGRLWASYWEAFGAPWAPKGPSLASLWSPFSFLGTPWGHLGQLGLPRVAWDDFGSKMDFQFRANGFQVARLRTKSDFVGINALSAGSPQSGAGAAAPDPTTLAPGARMR